jgi:hypothetical protein
MNGLIDTLHEMHHQNIHPYGIKASGNSTKKCKIIVLASYEKKNSFMSYEKGNKTDRGNINVIPLKRNHSK